MKRKTSIIALLLVLVMILSLGLVACNKNNGGGGGGDSTPTPDPDGMKVETPVMNPSNLDAYLKTFLKASGSVKPTLIQKDDAFVVKTHLDLIHEQFTEGNTKDGYDFRQANVEVGIDIEALIDPQNPINSSVSLLITDQAAKKANNVDHQIKLTALAKTANVLYVDYLGQQFKVEFNNGFIEAGEGVEANVIAELNKIMGTDIGKSIYDALKKATTGNTVMQTLLAAINQLPAKKGVYSGISKITPATLIAFIVNIPACDGDKTVVTDWNLTTPLNRMIQSFELVEFASIFGVNKILALIPSSPIVDMIKPNISSIFRVVFPDLTEDGLKLVLSGKTKENGAAMDALLTSNQLKPNLMNIVNLLLNPEATLIKNGMAAEEKAEVQKLVNRIGLAKDAGALNIELGEYKNGDVIHSLSLGTLIKDLPISLPAIVKGIKLQYVTNNDGTQIKGLGAIVSDSRKTTTINTGMMCTGLSVEKATADYATNLYNVVSKYSTDFGMDADLTLNVEGLKVDGISLDGTYKIEAKGALDFTKAGKNNIYLAISHNGGKMIEGTLVNDTVIIKMGKEAKMVELMKKYAGALVNKLETSKNENIKNGVAGLREKMLNADGSYKESFAGFKVQNVNIAKALCSAIIYNNTEKPNINIGPTLGYGTLNALNIIDPINVLQIIFTRGIKQDVNVDKFITIDLGIRDFFTNSDKKSGKFVSNIEDQYVAYLLASTPKYVSLYENIFDGLKDVETPDGIIAGTINVYQAELMYLLATDPTMDNAVKNLVKANIAYKAAVNGLTGDALAEAQSAQHKKYLGGTYTFASLKTPALFIEVMETLNCKAEITDEMIAEIRSDKNPLVKASNVLAGSKFYTNSTDIIKRLMKSHVTVDFVVNNNKATGNFELTCNGTKVGFEANLTVSAQKPAAAPTLTLSGDVFEKTLQYYTGTEEKFA